MYAHLRKTDPEVFAIIQAETRRQAEGLELIASENFVSEAVLEAAGSPLTNKYAEGYPGRRYYGGCEYVDTVEDLARQRAKALFGAEFANVQPHSGSQAPRRTGWRRSRGPARSPARSSWCWSRRPRRP